MSLSGSLAVCTPGGLAHSRGHFGFCSGATRPVLGRKAQLGHLSLAAKGPQGHHWVLTYSPEWPLLSQASSSSWALPSRALLVPEGGWVGRGSCLLFSPGTSVSSHALAFRGADPPDNWAWRGADHDASTVLGRVSVTGTLRILRLQLHSLHPATPLGVGVEFNRGPGGPGRCPQSPTPGTGLKDRASVVQALTIGCGQLVSITV